MGLRRVDIAAHLHRLWTVPNEGQVNIDDLLNPEFVRKMQAQERTYIERMKQDRCPTCAVHKNLDCRYRGVPEHCGIAPQVEAEARRQGRMQRMGTQRIPKKLWALLLSGKAKNTEALSYVLSFIAQAKASEGGRLLVLAGETGSGKSAAAAIGLLKYGGTWLDAMSELVRPMTDDRQEEVEIAPLVVIDDAGNEYMKDPGPDSYAAKRLCELVCARLDRWNLPTLITTNLTVGQWFGDKGRDGRYDQRLRSRLRGDPVGWHNVSTKDMRGADGRALSGGGQAD